jgi:ABC-type transport system involved in cytochrome c biogenesis permease subunit
VPDGSVGALAAGVCFVGAALFAARRRAAGVWLAAAGAAILAGVLVGRGLRAGHWPLTDEYEFPLAFALSTALAALIARRSHGVQALLLAWTAALVAYAQLVLPAAKRAVQPLPPALDGVWFPLHAGAAALGYGALVAASAAGLVWLIREPGRAQAERLMDRAVAAGYPLLTLSMLLGMVWAQVAWGRYWAWDLKEVWTLIAWLVYTLYWHLRGRPAWRGRRLAWLAVVGFGAVLFTFQGVGWLARTVRLDSLPLF